jgi:hypothetical protein
MTDQIAPAADAPKAKKGRPSIRDRADDLNEADRRDNRPRADYYAATLIASQAATVDELRYGRRKVAESRAREALELGDADQPAPAIKTAEIAAQPDLAAILQMIADGHNDARGLAEAALAKLAR